MAKEFLSQKGVEYNAHDVSKDPEAFEEMMDVAKGIRRFPVVIIGREVISGFDRNRLEQLINQLD